MRWLDGITDSMDMSLSKLRGLVVCCGSQCRKESVMTERLNWWNNSPWRRKWHPTPVFLPGESHGQRSLVGCSPWGHKSWTWLKRLSIAQHNIGLQHGRLPCPSLSPGACSNSCPLSQWCHPTISSSVVPFSCLQSFTASGFFSNESVLLIRWPKYWSFSFSISPSSEYSGLISFRIVWFDLLAVQGTLKSLLQHHS